MNTRIQRVDLADDGQTTTSLASAVRVHLATVLATAALFLAIAGVVYGPGFMTIESVAAEQAHNLSVLASVGAALRDQSPECLLQPANPDQGSDCGQHREGAVL